MSEETYYTVLGVVETATRAELRKAYRSLLKKIHPDTVSTLSQETRGHAEEATMELIEAYSVLSDMEQRTEYDRWLTDRRAMAAKVQAEGTLSAELNAAQLRSRCPRCGAILITGEACTRCRFRRLRSRRRIRRRRRFGHRQKTYIRDWMTVTGYVLLALLGLASLVYCLYVWSAGQNPSLDP
jgi:curved DNA-binding protein CbpA